MCDHAPPSHEENAAAFLLAVHVKIVFVNMKQGG